MEDEFDKLFDQLEKEVGLPKPGEKLPIVAPQKEGRAFKPTKHDTREFLKTKKRNKVARKSRRVNRGKRGGKRR